MNSKTITDTIAAISTPAGEGGIGIVRLSGPEAVPIADKVFSGKEKKSLRAFKTYTLHYGWIREDKPSGKIVDEVILSLMRKPKSYTREDVVEINCHGGIVALRRVLELVLGKGARLAEPGEFTRRAFLNGRIDLAQAEAVLDVIRAKTDYSLNLSARQLSGALSEELRKAREGLVDMLSALEAGIDFPEEELSVPQIKKISLGLKDINDRLLELLKGARAAQLMREGLNVAICGKTNVGKSSLLNALLRRERSIVTSLAGTTRDTVEELMDIKGVAVKIIDTAGIIKPRDEIEDKAVRRSRTHIDSSDLAILLFDASRPLSGEDLRLIRRLKGKEVLAVINKMDLKQKIDRKRLLKSFKHLIDISAKRNININLIEDAIAELAYSGKVSVHETSAISSLRHIEKLKKAQKFIAEAFKSVDNKSYSEYVCQDLRDATGCLDDILGKRFSEDLLDKIFADFCIGK